ncbi:hypothetical protein WA026_003272 [Henosepilachna vigintioctopunctata]|uniref:Carboxylesterase type B domain-containing protein n=1 Tax=Henosepilachna vigintioctopunctata TaxID=420089 RepID=A0AAW1TLQ5_9CUCU
MIFKARPTRSDKYPVFVFIHGESFEWNSGNPYDGSVLAAYGKVVVVTFNFRLGILGFLKTGTGDDSKSNFGLVDQIAALVWVRENIAAFGGDRDSVTLMGHGTGAVCASLLTLSPMVLPGNEPLFHRAILMGGTALADWALADNPNDITYQVARKLNCPVGDVFEACLREKHIDEIRDIDVFIRPYATRFGPVVDSRIVPYEPLKSMTNFSGIFRRFELMYGVTEMESVHFLGAIPFTYGMLKKERDQELRNYLRFTCKTRPEACINSILSSYAANINIMDDEAYSSGGSNTAGKVRDSLWIFCQTPEQ